MTDFVSDRPGPVAFLYALRRMNPGQPFEQVYVGQQQVALTVWPNSSGFVGRSLEWSVFANSKNETRLTSSATIIAKTLPFPISTCISIASSLRTMKTTKFLPWSMFRISRPTAHFSRVAAPKKSKDYLVATERYCLTRTISSGSARRLLLGLSTLQLYFKVSTSYQLRSVARLKYER